MTQASLISRRRLYQQVAEDIERQILNGTYPPDTRLPSEQELADTYGVSRNVVREALKSLSELALVSIRTGTGTFVRQPTMQPVSEALGRFLRHYHDGVSIAQLYDVRRMIEPECARIAAQRASVADMAAVKSAMSRMEDNQSSPNITIAADLEFHLAIAAGTHNPLVSSLLNPVIAPLHKLISTSHAYPKRLALGLDGHRRIYEAMVAHEPDLAYQAMLDHLDAGEKRYTGDVGLSPQDRL